MTEASWRVQIARFFFAVFFFSALGFALLGYVISAPDDYLRNCMQGECANSIEAFGDAPHWRLLLVPLVVVIFFRFVRPDTASKDNLASGRWADKKDMRAFSIQGNSKLVGYYGRLVNERFKPVTGRDFLAVPQEKRNTHTILVGGSGAGKTSALLLPNLLFDASRHIPTILFDLKYPDPKGLLQASDWFKAEGLPVIKVMPFDPANTMPINLLSGITSLSDAISMAGLIIPKGPARDGEIYENMAREILTALIYIQCLEGKPSLTSVLQLTRQGRKSLKEFIEARSYIAEKLHTLLEIKSDTFTGALQSVSIALEVFNRPELASTLDAPEEGAAFKFSDFEALNRAGGMLYAGIDQEAFNNGSGRMILQIFKKLIDQAVFRTSSRNEGHLPQNMTFYLDEFPSLGPIPNILENLATLRSYGVALTLATQNLAQIRAVYTRDVAEAIITSTFTQTVIFPRAINNDDKHWFSKQLGHRTIMQESKSLKKGELWLAPQTTFTTREATKPLLPIEEFASFPDDYGVVLMQGSPPARVQLAGLYNETHLLHRVAEELTETARSVDFTPLSDANLSEGIIGNRVELTTVLLDLITRLLVDFTPNMFELHNLAKIKTLTFICLSPDDYAHYRDSTVVVIQGSKLIINPDLLYLLPQSLHTQLERQLRAVTLANKGAAQRIDKQVLITNPQDYFADFDIAPDKDLAIHIGKLDLGELQFDPSITQTIGLEPESSFV